MEAEEAGVAHVSLSVRQSRNLTPALAGQIGGAFSPLTEGRSLIDLRYRA